MTSGLRNRFQPSQLIHDPESDTVTIPRTEYKRLKSVENKMEKLQLIIIWTLFVIFLIIIYFSISNSIRYNEKLGIKLDSYYENELSRVKAEAKHPLTENENFGKIRNNKRPGRIYHRGGNYGGRS